MLAGESSDLDWILRETARVAVDALGAAAIGIFQYAQEDDSLCLAAQCGLPAPLRAHFVRFPVTGFHNEDVVRHGRTRMHGSPADVPEFVRLGIPSAAPHLGTYLCVPLSAKGQVVGVMGIFSRRPRVFDDRDHALYRTIGEQIGLAIANARLYESVQQLAVTDSLTGLYNRRFLDGLLEKELERCARYQHGVALIMLDIDHFKTYNDTFGHPAGDEALQEIATIVCNSIRASDIVARYGGEEFAIVLPETEGPGATVAAEKIRAAILGHEFPRGRLTASLGVAWCRDEVPSTPAELICKADHALYKAKRDGRNRVCVWEEAQDLAGSLHIEDP